MPQITPKKLTKRIQIYESNFGYVKNKKWIPIISFLLDLYYEWKLNRKLEKAWKDCIVISEDIEIKRVSGFTKK